MCYREMIICFAISVFFPCVSLFSLGLLLFWLFVRPKGYAVLCAVLCVAANVVAIASAFSESV